MDFLFDATSSIFECEKYTLGFAAKSCILGRPSHGLINRSFHPQNVVMVEFL